MDPPHFFLNGGPFSFEVGVGSATAIDPVLWSIEEVETNSSNKVTFPPLVIEPHDYSVITTQLAVCLDF